MTEEDGGGQRQKWSRADREWNVDGRGRGYREMERNGNERNERGIEGS